MRDQDKPKSLPLPLANCTRSINPATLQECYHLTALQMEYFGLLKDLFQSYDHPVHKECWLVPIKTAEQAERNRGKK